MQAAASLAQIPIYVLTKGASEDYYKWVMYKLHLKANLKFPNKDVNFQFDNILSHLEICDTNGNHYECVINVPLYLWSYRNVTNMSLK